MDKTLWQNVETLFHKALELPEHQRLRFVQKAAGKNAELQFEVLTLLKSYENEDGFLENNSSPDWSDTLEQLANEFQRKEFGEPTETRKTQKTTETPKLPKPVKSGLLSTNDIAKCDLSTNDDHGDTDLVDDDASLEFQLVEMVESTRPDFVVKKVINRGGMGTVLRVYQRKLDRDVAIKVLSTMEVDERMRRRFVRESKAAAHVRNDHVIDIHEVCNDPDVPFLVMELVEGPSLKRFMELQDRISPRIAAELTRQIAVGLAAAHEQNLVHRDIKPANVLLERHHWGRERGHATCGEALDYRAKIIDFGLARDVDNPMGEARDQVFAGTLSYMSPEQLFHPDKVDHRSDIYSLGMTLYQMMTGEQPIRGAPHMVMRKIAASQLTAPRKLDGQIPKDLESICLKALSKERSRRYQSAREFADDLTRFLDGRPTMARPVSRAEKTTRWFAHNKRVAGLVAGLLLLLSIATLLFALTIQKKNRELEQHRAKTIEALEMLDQRPLDGARSPAGSQRRIAVSNR